jgi:hypothetical protein
MCVNPEHLEAVTKRENTLRGFGITALNYRKTHCLKGHKFTEENTYYEKPDLNHRRCKECKRLRRLDRNEALQGAMLKLVEQGE